MSSIKNPLLFKSMYDIPQSMCGNEVLELKYGFNNFLKVFT